MISSDQFIVVRGLTKLQQQEFLHDVDEEPLSSDEIPGDVTALGDFGVAVLVFAATAGILTAMCRWVERQPERTKVVLEIFKVFRIEVEKGMSPDSIMKKLDEKI